MRKLLDRVTTTTDCRINTSSHPKIKTCYRLLCHWIVATRAFNLFLFS